MSEIIDVEQDDDPMDIARKWYLRLEDSSWDETVIDSLNKWLDQNEENRAAFEEVAIFWSEIDTMPEIMALRETEAQPPLHLKERLEANSEPEQKNKVVPITQHHRTPSAPSRRFSGIQRWAMAASLLLVCSLGLIIYSNDLPDGTYQTATGERQIIELTDGSTLFLNTHSKASVIYTDTVRKVNLIEGEARFNVEKDATRPFIVETSRGIVRAIGTSFNIYDNETQVEVIVFEGTVAVNHSNNRTTKLNTLSLSEEGYSTNAVLVSGGKRIAALENGLSVVRPAHPLELSQKIAWQSGKLIFRGQKLSEVIKEMSRYTSKKIIISDDRLGEMEIGGAFDTDDFEALLNAIEDTFPVRIIRFTPLVAVIIEA
tara:strand:+ start:8093 stop:9208 length:1116 start_codon:yes stop_codon:yes gene_type:complete